MRSMLEIAASALGAGTAAGLPIVLQSGPFKGVRRLMCIACNLRLRPWRGIPGSGVGIGIPFGGGGTTFQDDGSRTVYDDHGRAVTTLPPSPPSIADRLNDYFSPRAGTDGSAYVSSGRYGNNEAGHSEETAGSSRTDEP